MARRVRSQYARGDAHMTALDALKRRHQHLRSTPQAQAMDLLRARVCAALIDAPGCIVCGHPTGIRCCEFGRDR